MQAASRSDGRPGSSGSSGSSSSIPAARRRPAAAAAAAAAATGNGVVRPQLEPAQIDAAIERAVRQLAGVTASADLDQAELEAAIHRALKREIDDVRRPPRRRLPPSPEIRAAHA